VSSAWYLRSKSDELILALAQILRKHYVHVYMSDILKITTGIELREEID
jgi:hypothetical protein